MEWNEIWTNLQPYIYGLGGVFTAQMALSGFNTIRQVVFGKKLSKVVSFSALADVTMKNVPVKMENIMLKFMKAVEDEIVKPLKEEITVVKNDNQALANLVVLSMAMTNVPLSQKKEIFNAITKIQSITNETAEYLKQQIADQEQSVTVSVVEDQELDNLIEEEVA